MKFRISALILFAVGAMRPAFPQPVLTLQECYDLAAKRTSLAGEKDIYQAIWQLKDRNLSRTWLPTLDANASFLYNSEVVDLSSAFSSIPLPGIENAIPSMPNEQYKVTLDINQLIYDGGSVRKSRKLDEAEMMVNRQQTESDLYKIRGQINSVYFSILLLERQKDLLQTYLDVIGKRIRSIQSGVDNGVILKADLEVMTSEKIGIDQQLTEIDLKRSALEKILCDLTGIDPGTKHGYILPQTGSGMTGEISRPELKVFDLKLEQLEAGMGVLQSRRMPKAFGFATFGYGRPPGNNFFEDQFSSYYIVGAGIKWNIYDWDRVRNEKKQLALQQGMVEGRKADLTDNLRRSLEAKEADIAGLEAALSRDSEIIALRKNITVSAESQYENGTITATELLQIMNSEKQAEINGEIHRISLEMARIEYLNISGKEIE